MNSVTYPVAVTAASGSDWSAYFISDNSQYTARNWGGGENQVVKLAEPAGATVTDATVSGITGAALSNPPTVTLTLTNETFKDTLIVGKGVTDWFANIPAGIAATVSSIAPNRSSLVVAFSGTPTVFSTDAMQIDIPYDQFSSGMKTDVTANANAKWNIKKGITVSDGTVAITKVYDGGVIAGTLTGKLAFDGVEVGDDVTIAAVHGAYAAGAQNVGEGKTVEITLSLNGANKDDYALASGTYTFTKATITPAPITVTGDGTAKVTKPYDGTSSAGTLTGALAFTGKVGEEAVGVDAVPGEYAQGEEDAGGNKTVTLALTLTGSAMGNYALASDTYTFTKAAIAKATYDPASVATAVEIRNGAERKGTLNISDLFTAARPAPAGAAFASLTPPTDVKLMRTVAVNPTDSTKLDYTSKNNDVTPPVSDVYTMAITSTNYVDIPASVAFDAQYNTMTVTLNAGDKGIAGFETSADGVHYTAYTGAVTVLYGTDLYIRARMAEGYVFLQWNDGNTANPRKLENITSDASYTAVSTIACTGIGMISDRTMAVGEKEYLVVTLEPEGALPKHLVWETSDGTIAVVKDSLVAAIAPGTAVITASSRADSAVCATCRITVRTKEEAPGVEGIIGDTTRRDFVIGNGKKLDLGEFFGGLYVWTSDDPGVATVSGTGVIKGIAEGKTTVRGTFAKAAKTVMVGDEVTVSVEVVKKSLAVRSVAISPDKAALDIGGTVLLTGNVAPSTAQDKTLIWSTGAPEVAVVDDTGLVTAVGAGRTSITATASSGVKKSITVSVRDAGVAPAPSAPTSISISPDTRRQRIGEITTLNLFVKPANAQVKGLTWASADAGIATVDSATGRITGIAEGETTITATLGNLAATCRLIVAGDDEPEETLMLHANFLALSKGKKLKLNALTGFKGSWASADSKIATVSGSGVLKVKDTGETTLTFSVGSVTTKDARFMGKSLIAGDSIDIKLIVVGKGKAVTKVNLPKTATLAPGETLAITATVSPKKAAYKELNWRSENTDIATVNEAGVVTGVAKGKAKIIATATSGISKTVTVTVRDAIVKLALNKSKATIGRGKTYQLSLKSYLPAGLSAPALIWASGKESVATVDGTGLVTAVKKGKATITATDPLTGAKATCMITVK